MPEKTVGLEIEKAYAYLKALLLKKGCKIIAEEPPALISVKQGSLWGIHPKSAKKVISYRFSRVDSGTRITYSSSLAPDWKNLSLIGSAVAVLVVSLCWWIASDLETFMVTQKPSYWSWIATVDGYIDFQAGQTIAGLTMLLAVFLALVIVLEIGIMLYVHHKRNQFAEESLSLLH